MSDEASPSSYVWVWCLFVYHQMTLGTTYFLYCHTTHPGGECIHEKCNKHSTRAQTIWQTLVLDESLWGWNVLQIHWFGNLSSPSYYSTVYAKKWKPRALPVDEILDIICPCPYDIWCWGRDEAIHVCMHNHTWKNIPLIRSILRRWKCQLISGVPCIKLLT